jgi:glycerophosphoryl diester phosphodiesterase
MGADGIEGDFRLTADGQIVCIHDATTGRLAKVNLPVEACDYEQLRTINIAASFAPEEPAVRIPLLSEVLETVPHGKLIFIELKSGPAIVPPLLDLLAHCPLAHEQIILFSFNINVLKTIQSKHSPYPTGYIVDFAWDRNGQMSPSIENALDTAQQLGCAGLHIGADTRLPNTIGQQAQARGLRLHTWTVDTQTLYQTMKSCGVQSITTNQPDTFLKEMSEG